MMVNISLLPRLFYKSYDGKYNLLALKSFALKAIQFKVFFFFMCFLVSQKIFITKFGVFLGTIY